MKIRYVYVKSSSDIIAIMEKNDVYYWMILNCNSDFENMEHWSYCPVKVYEELEKISFCF